MNNILISNNKLNNYQDNNIIIKDNTIKFLNNGEYNLEIINSNNLNLNLELKENITVKLFILSINNNIISNITYTLKKHSNLILFKFYNNKEVEEKEKIYLEQEYSSISYNFSSICKKYEKYKMQIYHNDNHVTSNISNKCLGNNNSKITFDIDSILDKGNIGCYMNQDTKIICMGDVDAKINPNMYIEEDDVEARHGSVIGKFNDEDLFYLMSRGIPKEEAIKLMIKGFILSNLVVNMDNRAKILEIINEEYK